MAGWIRTAAIVSLCNVGVIAVVDRLNSSAGGSRVVGNRLALFAQAATPVPEPTSLVLLGAGLVAITFRYRRRSPESSRLQDRE